MIGRTNWGWWKDTKETHFITKCSCGDIIPQCCFTSMSHRYTGENEVTIIVDGCNSCHISDSVKTIDITEPIKKEE